jgi:outer membrane protein TolC
MSKTKSKLKYFAFLLALLCGGAAWGQNQEKAFRLSLNDALKRAEENNWQIKMAGAEVMAAKAEYQQSHSVFLPNLSLSHTGITTNDPLTAFGLKLKQEIATTADFNPVLLNDPNRIDNFSTRVEVQQPLLNFDGFYGRKAAGKQLDAMQYKQKRTVYNVRFQVKKVYYQHQLAQESLHVVQKSLEAARDNLKLTENNLKQGFVKEADLLSAKVRVLELENQMADAENLVKRASEFLAYLLGMKPTTGISTTDKLEEGKFPVLPVEINLESRSDILAYRKGVEARESLLKSNRMKFLPNLNGFGSYEWNDDQMFGNQASNYVVGAKLTWNLFSGYKNIGAVKKAKAQLQKAEVEFGEYQARNTREMQEARRNLRIAFNKIQVTKLAREQAGESLRIRTNRYKQGLEKTTDLLFAEATQSARELDYLRTLYQYHIALFQMELLLEAELK